MAKKSKKKLTVQGVPHPTWTGKHRNMLWVPDDKRQEGEFMKSTWTLTAIAAVLCAPFVNIVCWCKAGAIPAALAYIGLKRGEDGKVVVDPEKTDFKGLRNLVDTVPPYVDASIKPSRVKLEAGLVRACLAAAKDSVGRVPAFLHRGKKEIQDLGYPVVENYGTDVKVLDYPTGDLVDGVMIQKPKQGRTVVVGVAHPEKGIEKSWCLEVSEYAVVFSEGPLALARAMEGDEGDLALAKAWLEVVNDVFVGQRYLGFVERGDRPSPLGAARAAAHVLAAVAPLLSSTNECSRPREFDDLKNATSCGGGEWPMRILTLYAFVSLVLVALANDIPVPEERRQDEKAAVAAARAAWADDARRLEIEALFAKVLPPKGLGKAGRDLVVAALKKGVKGNAIVIATEGAHALCAEDSELRVVLKYLEMRQNERAAAVYKAIAPKMRIVVGDSRWEVAESHNGAVARAERVAAAEVASKDVSWASMLAREAAAQRAAQEEKATSFESVVGGVVDDVVERAPSKFVFFKDVRAAVAVCLRADAPHFSEEIQQLATGAPGTFGVKTLKAALRERGFTVGRVDALRVQDASLCVRLPAVAGAEPSSPRTAPVSPRASPRGDGVSFPSINPPVNRADRSRSRDEKPDSDDSGADSGGGCDSSGDEMAP